MLAASGGGVSVEPDDPARFTDAIRAIVEDLDAAVAMGERARRWVESAASPAAVAEVYESLVRSLHSETSAERRRQRSRRCLRSSAPAWRCWWWRWSPCSDSSRSVWWVNEQDNDDDPWRLRSGPVAVTASPT